MQNGFNNKGCCQFHGRNLWIFAIFSSSYYKITSIKTCRYSVNPSDVVSRKTADVIVPTVFDVRDEETHTCKCTFQLSGRHDIVGVEGVGHLRSSAVSLRHVFSAVCRRLRYLERGSFFPSKTMYDRLSSENLCSSTIRRTRSADSNSTKARLKHTQNTCFRCTHHYNYMYVHSSMCDSENECYPVTSARWSEGITTDREDGKYSAIWLGVTCEGTSSTTTTRDAATKQRFETHRSKMTAMHQIKPLTDVWINSVVQYLINSRFWNTIKPKLPSRAISFIICE